MMPRFTISILALDNIDLTRKCVDSVLSAGGDIELILTNNGSGDGTKEYFDGLAKELTHVRAVHNASNLGFQVPHKRALDIANGEFFVLLNNDTEVPKRWLEILVQPFSDESVALSGPFGNCCSLSNDFHGFPGPKFEYLEGSCLMCRTSVVREHGLFSDYLEFAYGEDSDLSLRMRRLGYRLARVPMQVKHTQGATSKKVAGIWQYQDRNHAVLVKKWSNYLRTRRLDNPIIVRRKGAIGDVLLTTPVIHSLAQERPLSKIYVETQFPELFDKNPDVDKADRGIPVTQNTEVIDLNMAYERTPDIPIIECYAAVADIRLTDRFLRFYGPATLSGGFAEARLGDSSDPICAMHLGPTTWPGKNWPVDRFAAIANWMMGRGWRVMLIGSGGDINIPRALDLRSRTTIAETAALLRRASLFVGVDSFPMHLAMSQEVPVVAVFGATLPNYIFSDGLAIGVHAPIGSVACIGARHRTPGSTFVGCDGECIRAVSINMVKEAINQFIGFT